MPYDKLLLTRNCTNYCGHMENVSDKEMILEIANNIYIITSLWLKMSKQKSTEYDAYYLILPNMIFNNIRLEESVNIYKLFKKLNRSHFDFLQFCILIFNQLNLTTSRKINDKSLNSIITSL